MEAPASQVFRPGSPAFTKFSTAHATLTIGELAGVPICEKLHRQIYTPNTRLFRGSRVGAMLQTQHRASLVLTRQCAGVTTTGRA